MKHAFAVFSVLGFLLSSVQLNAQNQIVGNELRERGFGRNALQLNINAEVLEDDIVVWNQIESKITIPGRPVRINLVGSNIAVVFQFTPFIRRGGNVLVAQGQIWIEDPGAGVAYYTSIQTIPMELDEPIHFFPLGTSEQTNPSIEIVITVNPVQTENTRIEGTEQ